MGYRIRQLNEETKFCEEMQLSSLTEVVSIETIKTALRDEGLQEGRVRQLNFILTILIVIGMGLCANLSIGHVIEKMAKGVRFIYGEGNHTVVGASGFSYRRYQIGASVMVNLFKRVCRPIATEKTKGAFLFGLRLMAIDGSDEEVADTAENERAFGKYQLANGQTSPFPHIRTVYLAECGTHAIVDAGIWPLSSGERVGAKRMLRSVCEGMLVMWDRGIHSFDMIADTRAQGAHVLGRLPAHVKPQKVKMLADGSYLADLRPSDYKRRKNGETIRVRIIEYRITDPALADCEDVHRLVTTLLDPEQYPAIDLVCAYHERWEIELVIDEIDTHQLSSRSTLRSLKPVGVIQEMYGILLAHFIVRFLMHEAAQKVDIDRDRLSFTHAVTVLKNGLDEFQMVDPAQRPVLYQRMLDDIASERLPIRRLRIHPRVIKKKGSKFLKKRLEHQNWPQPKTSFRDAISVI